MATPFLLCLYLCYCSLVSRAQSISTNTPVPPFQWINLSPLLQGSTAPPPLRDVALGYDEASRSLVVFGGESAGGFVQSQTYLLNMNTLTWSIPSPPANLDVTPPARSSAVSAIDIAASNRHAFIVLGGKGSNDVALSDVWAFDFTNQFWSLVTPTNSGPAPRWGATGGIDIRVPPIQDAVVPGPNNTIYLAGGFDGTTAYPLSDVWRLNISGTLSANLPQNVGASWEKIPVQRSLPSKVGQGGGIINQQIISVGGCNVTFGETSDDFSCAQQDSFVVDVGKGTVISPGPCPAPRMDPVLIGNLNGYSTNFASQVLMVLGTFNSTIWDDEDALHKGEIDILDANTGAWSRILPSGDPGTTGRQTYPAPREGASAFSYDRALVGTMRNGISDTIIFGGRDSLGNYLSDMWLLRSYRDSLTSSATRWSGFGDGTLKTGVNADGSGAFVEYLTKCPFKKLPTPKPPNGTHDDTIDPTLSHPPSSGSVRVDLETGIIHKLFASVSLVLLLLSFLLLRVVPSTSPAPTLRHRYAKFGVGLCTIGAYVIGLVGFIFSFASLRRNPMNNTLETQNHLSTSHGNAALAFFVCLYGAVPCLLLASAALSLAHRARNTSDAGSGMTGLRRTVSETTNEKPDHNFTPSHPPSINGVYSLPVSPRPRTQSALSYPSRSNEGISTDGESTVSGPRRGFEVLNRPAGRHTKLTESWPTSSSSQPLPTSRSLGDIDWMLRRRSLNAVGELDYALSLAQNAAQRNSATTAVLTSPPSLHAPATHTAPSPLLLNVVAYILTQIGFLGLNIITSIALWRHAPHALFVIFLVWVTLFYVLIICVPQRFESEAYLLSTITRRLAKLLLPSSTSSSIPPFPPAPPAISVTPPLHGPYMHQPPFSRTVPGDSSFSPRGPLSVEEDEEEEDIDEPTRQRMIEEEMDRREVSIITMPKRKLWVANPS